MRNIVPSRDEFERRIPAAYRRNAGIGPYYLPVFGRMYTKRLGDCLRAARRYANAPAAVLDAGCGLGLATAALADLYPKADVFGLDMYPDEILRYAGKLMPGSARVRFVSGSIEAAPFASKQFDLITAFDMLEHVPHPETALDEIARMLSPSGIVVVSVPIESPILGALRYIALAGGRRGEIHPHWEGTCKDVGAFEAAWLKRFAPISTFNTPLRQAPRIVNYDVVLIGRARGEPLPDQRG